MVVVLALAVVAFFPDLAAQEQTTAALVALAVAQGLLEVMALTLLVVAVAGVQLAGLGSVGILVALVARLSTRTTAP